MSRPPDLEARRVEIDGRHGVFLAGEAVALALVAVDRAQRHERTVNGGAHGGLSRLGDLLRAVAAGEHGETPVDDEGEGST